MYIRASDLITMSIGQHVIKFDRNKNKVQLDSQVYEYDTKIQFVPAVVNNDIYIVCPFLNGDYLRTSIIKYEKSENRWFSRLTRMTYVGHTNHNIYLRDGAMLKTLIKDSMVIDDWTITTSSGTVVDIDSTRNILYIRSPYGGVKYPFDSFIISDEGLEIIKGHRSHICDGLSGGLICIISNNYQIINNNYMTDDSVYRKFDPDNLCYVPQDILSVIETVLLCLKFCDKQKYLPKLLFRQNIIPLLLYFHDMPDFIIKYGKYFHQCY